MPVCVSIAVFDFLGSVHDQYPQGPRVSALEPGRGARLIETGVADKFPLERLARSIPRGRQIYRRRQSSTDVPARVQRGF